MISTRRALSVALALGLAGLAAPSAFAQNYLAVSEVVGGSPQGQVQIFTQNNGSLGSLVATISGNGLSNPFGMAYNPTSSSTGDLYIGSLGTNQIYDYKISSGTPTLSSIINLGTLGDFNPNGLLVSNGTLYVSMYDAGTVASPGAVLVYNLSNLASTPIRYSNGSVLQGPTGLAISSDGLVYVNSSRTNSVDLLASPPVLLPVSLSGSPTGTPNAPAGMLITGSTLSGGATLYETNFFGSSQGISSYSSTGATGFTFTTLTTGGYANNPFNGGPADIVAAAQSGFLLVSDYGDGKIYEYTTGLTGPTLYGTLAAGTAPTHLVSFSTSGVVLNASAVPEPSSVALLGLGAAAGLVARRRLRRAKSAG